MDFPPERGGTIAVVRHTNILHQLGSGCGDFARGLGLAGREFLLEVHRPEFATDSAVGFSVSEDRVDGLKAAGADDPDSLGFFLHAPLV